jgi:2-polyprenyl-6-methoxyphenol hydroxylase-like FAD-dependent oxidoreductase
VQGVGFSGVPLDISDFPTRHNCVLALRQSQFERVRAAWVSELGVPAAREREVTGFAQDGTGVDVEAVRRPVATGGLPRRCDGGRSVIRKAAGIEFPGWDPPTSPTGSEE